MSDQIIVCPHCGSSNRIAAGRPLKEAKCGKCHQMLFDGQPAPVDAAAFDRHVQRSDVPVVVDFWADWCGPCHAMAPSFEAAARELEPRMRFLKLDTEAEPQIAGRYNIRGIPNLIVFKKGQILGQRAGAMDGRTLTSWLSQYAT
ncbi:thioredoxin TrxC [Devosia sp. ZB163]|uniref:thioredoxin TrxC n=1 Tax=Devosia sp. ZB163 TaxID=3025938 RepID=UPI002361A7AD|nr:thioredoxin TrxC [Devosia sp. ZB163]MDC9824998.1 thioredoxin TrxC [Devosia sp. ZB163]